MKTEKEKTQAKFSQCLSSKIKNQNHSSEVVKVSVWVT